MLREPSGTTNLCASLSFESPSQGGAYKANVGGSIPSAPTNQITHLRGFFFMQSAAARSLRDFFRRLRHRPGQSNGHSRCAAGPRHALFFAGSRDNTVDVHEMSRTKLFALGRGIA